MYFKRAMQYIVISVRYYYYHDYYYTGLLEYLLKFNDRGIIIHGQNAGGAGSFRRYGLVQAILHDHCSVVRDFGSTWHRFGVNISEKHKKHQAPLDNRKSEYYITPL